MGYFGGGGGGSGNVSGTFTATRVPFAQDASTLVDDADMTFVTDTLTVTKVQPTTIELGNVSDTTLSRAAAGAVAIEGDRIMTLGASSAGQSVSAGYIWTAGQVYNTDVQLRMGSGTNSIIRYDSNNTPDTLMVGVPASSNTLRVTQLGDINTDSNNGPSGTSAAGHPGILLNNAGASTTQYLGLFYYGMAGRAIKSLTAASATAVVQIPIAAGAGTGATIHYTVFASDGTDHQARHGCVRFATVNKAGTETAAVYGVDSAFTVNPDQTKDGSGAGAISSGTLTYTWGVDTSPSNAVNLTLNAASSLTENVLDIYYRVDMTGPGQPVPQ